jgi:hypothetical protein
MLSAPGLVNSPVDNATATATPRSTPTTAPTPGAGIGSGITANAICQRPARSPVMRCDFHPASARLALKQTQPIFAHQHTGSCPVVLPDPHSLRSEDPQALILAGFTPPRAPMGPGKESLPPWSRSRNACCWIVCEPQASHDSALRASVSCAAWALKPGVGPCQRRHIRGCSSPRFHTYRAWPHCSARSTFCAALGHRRNLIARNVAVASDTQVGTRPQY